MKKAVIFVIIFAIIVTGILLYRIDKKNIEEKQEPKYCLKFVDEDKKQIKYLCLGYALYREYIKSPNEAMNDSKSLKFGVWFFEKEEIKYGN